MVKKSDLAAMSSKIATPVQLEDMDFGNKSSIVDCNGERIIVCNSDISKALITLINSQHSYSNAYDNESLFMVSSEIWDHNNGYLECELPLSNDVHNS